MAAGGEAVDYTLIAGTAALSLLVCFAISLILLRIKALVDAPNERSSHSVPASRAGGVAICAGWAVGAVAFLVMRGSAADGALAGLAGGAAVSFAAGLLDDRKTQRASVKLAAQVAAAALFVLLAGSLQSAPAPLIGAVDLGPVAGPLTIFGIVAFMNAYNFMDGLNGIAASCALAALAAMAIAAGISGLHVVAGLSALLAAALAGFLPVNMRSGRLFMGDSGSQFVGFLIAALAVLLANGSGGGVSIYFAPVVFAPFIFDVAFTLVARMRRKQNIFSAHREHIYQRLAHGGLGHTTVTAIYFGLTVFSAAIATLTVLLRPEHQWIPPVALLACFAAPVFFVLRSRGGGASVRSGD